MAGYARHLVALQARMDHLSSLAGRLDVGRRMATLARHVALAPHRLAHSFCQLDPARLPRLFIVKVGGHFSDDIANPRFHMHVSFHEKIRRWHMAAAATRADTGRIADMRGLLIVRVGRDRGHAVTGRAAKRDGRCVTVDLRRNNNPGRPDHGCRE